MNADSEIKKERRRSDTMKKHLYLTVAAVLCSAALCSCKTETITIEPVEESLVRVVEVTEPETMASPDLEGESAADETRVQPSGSDVQRTQNEEMLLSEQMKKDEAADKETATQEKEEQAPQKPLSASSQPSPSEARSHADTAPRRSI